jgi:hypothetical protein
MTDGLAAAPSGIYTFNITSFVATLFAAPRAIAHEPHPSASLNFSFRL